MNHTGNVSARASNPASEPLEAWGEYELGLDKAARHYNAVVAVHDVSLHVAQGELVTLLGPSGSGKTTTLMMIAGFVYPTRGRVFFRGQNITYMPPHLRNIGMVFQHYSLFPHMTVSENIAFPLRMRKVSRDEIRRSVQAALALVDLAGYEARMPAELSGGQQQRIALARALVFRPAILLMDEPLGALDKSMRERMQLEIKRIQAATGVTIIYVTHDQQEALVLSDRIIVMEKGRVRMQGSPADVYERPADAFVARFMGETNLLQARVVDVGLRHCVVRANAGLEMAVPTAARCREGEQITLSLRPEKIRPAPEGVDAGDMNVGVGSVTEVVYLGDVLKYRVVLDGAGHGVPLIAKTLAGFSEARITTGDRVRIGWRPSDVWILPEEHGPDHPPIKEEPHGHLPT